MDYKCKICAGDLDVDFTSGVAVCQYCGVKQTIPTFTSEKSNLLYEQAQHMLKQNEFDKATNLFNQLLITDKSNSDVYWSLLMCKYGVTYVEDPKTKKFMPTCNRTHFGSILNEELYTKAIEFANAEKKKYYTETANEIDGIQKKILSISKKEKPFDIFISYKETTIDGQRTKDSIVAQEIYEDLTNAGYKVFFSRITLEDKIGTDYEPYIYAALASSKLMITVCSSSENINSVWVRNEWSRYIGLCQNDKSKSLIPLYFDMEATQLPDEFASLPSYNINADGFKQELLRGIKKLIPLPIMLAQKRKKRRKILAISSAVLALCMAVGFVLYIPNIKKNNQYNKIMAMYHDGQYPQALWEFEKMGNFKDSEIMVEKCESSWRNSVNTVISKNYLSASSSWGSYYITANGSVEDFTDDPGDSHANIKINEHGKIVSLGDNDKLLALHEDGTLDNYKSFEKYDNIIKISTKFNATPVALLSDGTLVYGENLYSNNEGTNDEWLKDISQWKDIVDFRWYVSRYGFGGCDAAIIGIHSDGSLSVVYGFLPDTYGGGSDSYYVPKALNGEKELKDYIDSLSDIKDLSFDLSLDYQNKLCFNMVAITNDGKLIKRFNNSSERVNVKDAVSVKYSFEYDRKGEKSPHIYFLTSEGILCEYNGKEISPDVVYIDDNLFFVTNSGSVYLLGDNGAKSLNIKTRVFDEWTLKNFINASNKIVSNKTDSISSQQNTPQLETTKSEVVFCDFFEVTLPDFWQDSYYCEKTTGSWLEIPQSMYFYELKDYERNQGGFLFGINVVSKEYADDPDTEPLRIGRIVGNMKIGQVEYYVCLSEPTDVQFEDDTQELYSKMSDSSEDVLKSMTSDDYTITIYK